MIIEDWIRIRSHVFVVMGIVMTIAILFMFHWGLLDLLPHHKFASIGVATNEKRMRIGTAGYFVVVCGFQSSEAVDIYCQRKGIR